MSEQLFCIEHEEMVKAEMSIYVDVEFIHVIIEFPDNINWCEFPLGYAYCPPPEFDMDEFMETQETPLVIDSDFLPYTYDVERDEIVQEVLI